MILIVVFRMKRKTVRLILICISVIWVLILLSWFFTDYLVELPCNCPDIVKGKNIRTGLILAISFLIVSFWFMYFYYSEKVDKK
jgi:hypothetical protein